MQGFSVRHETRLFASAFLLSMCQRAWRERWQRSTFLLLWRFACFAFLGLLRALGLHGCFRNVPKFRQVPLYEVT
eukprot:365689-Amphidinium_carterae.2